MIHKEALNNSQHLSQFDVNASPQLFGGDSINNKAFSFGCFIIFFVRLCELWCIVILRAGHVNDLGIARCHFTFSFYFLTTSSSTAHAMISVCAQQKKTKKSETYSITPLKFLHSLLHCSLISPMTQRAL